MFTICSLYVHYILAKSQNTFGYRVKNLMPKIGGSFTQVFTVYFHYLFTICSLYVHYMFTICWRNLKMPEVIGLTTCRRKMVVLLCEFLLYIFTIYLLYVHYMFIVCSLHVHYVFTICWRYLKMPSVVGFQTLGRKMTVLSWKFLLYIFAIYLLYVHSMFTICSLYVQSM